MSSRRTRTDEGSSTPAAEMPVEVPVVEAVAEAPVEAIEEVAAETIVEVTIQEPVVAGVSASAAAGYEMPPAGTVAPPTSGEVVQPSAAAAGISLRKGLSSQPLDLATAEILLKIYNQKRIDGQISFYKSRVREFEANAGFMLGMSALIMGVSSFVSAVGAFANNPGLALITTLLPAFAALMASFRQLYQWEKQSVLYRDAMLGLEEAKLVMPDDDLFDPRTSGILLPRVVNVTEEVFVAEMNQWGQIALGSKDSKDDDDELNHLLRNLHAQDEENASTDSTSVGAG